MEEKRNKHYHLNHFNIIQLTYLCKKLSCNDHENNFPDQVYQLLARFSTELSYEYISDCVEEVTKYSEDLEYEDDIDDFQSQGTVNTLVSQEAFCTYKPGSFFSCQLNDLILLSIAAKIRYDCWKKNVEKSTNDYAPKEFEKNFSSKKDGKKQNRLVKIIYLFSQHHKKYTK